MSGPLDASFDGGGRVSSDPGDTVSLTMTVLVRRDAGVRCCFVELVEKSVGGCVCWSGRKFEQMKAGESGDDMLDA